MKPKDKKGQAITDSVGFWLVLFCGFGLAMLMLTHETVSKKMEKNAARAVGLSSSPLEKKEPAEKPVDSGRKSMIFLYVILGIGIFTGLVVLRRQKTILENRQAME